MLNVPYCYNCPCSFMFPYYFMCPYYSMCHERYNKKITLQYDFSTHNINKQNTLLKNASKDYFTKVNLQNQTINPETFKISYPFLKNYEPDEIKDIINDEITNKVLDLFKNQVLIPEKIDFAEIISFYEVPLNDKGLLSILFGIYTYVEKAAHGFTKYASITIDIKTGKIYDFGELFNPKFFYKPLLDELAKEYIIKNNVPLLTEYNGVQPNQEFYLTPTSLVMYYQVYEYTPYAYGLFKIEIPYEKIKTILSPASPIQRLL
ncbi:DUF3298 and DUF4163 domain-containing protein [Haloimpatiens massiliensis]|uniref:DUF3298 and DUF4163 domain-containing protein n=1 Tax=Haloimpatiens massiliensis TaxID=1658110 RepID=UPI000C82617C|nr:DUF3298 and DUF4163 domain-containing protein [Haloimpatiens massiliensis]